MVAFRSVTLPTHPPSTNYTRGETLCSGFCVWPQSEEMSKVRAAATLCTARGFSLHAQL